MPMTAAPASVAIGTAMTTIYTNPSNSGEIQTIEVQLVNYDGVNDADVVQAGWTDASAASVFSPLVPNNYTLKAKLGLIAFRKVLEPGDSVRAMGSAAGDIHATAEKIFAEPSA